MYRRHLLSIDHVQQLLYHQVLSDTNTERRTLRALAFFMSEGDRGFKRYFFPHGSEAMRRILFFAQALTTHIPEQCRYSSSWHLIISPKRFSCLYVKSLGKRINILGLRSLSTWNTCIPLNGTILLSSRGVDHVQWSEPFGGSDEKSGNAKTADGLPFYRIEFKSSAPELTLHTRIQVSLRAQTRYRTVSGMMNYAKAIKLLYCVENPEVIHIQLFDGNTDKLERGLERMARRKFKFVVSAQCYSKFNPI